VKGIEPSSSAWKGDAGSTISEVITENEPQNSSLNVDRFFHFPQRSSGPARSAAFCQACGAQFSPRRRALYRIFEARNSGRELRLPDPRPQFLWRIERRRKPLANHRLAIAATEPSQVGFTFGFCNGPGLSRVISPLATHPFRRGRASVRGRRAGRHLMGFERIGRPI
jgi:hypothetical protein